MRYKSIIFQGLKNDDNELIVESILATEKRDREGDIMRVDGARVVGKPIVTLCGGRTPLKDEPIARPLLIETTMYKGTPAIMAKTRFFDNAIGRRLYQKTTTGYMPYWAVGYQIINSKPLAGGGLDITEWDLLNYSLVGVSSNPDAVTISKMYKSLIY